MLHGIYIHIAYATGVATEGRIFEEKRRDKHMVGRERGSRRENGKNKVGVGQSD